jgi:hypothetical protein
MSFLVSRFSPFKLSSISGVININTGSSVTMNAHSTALAVNSTSAVTSTLGQLLVCNIRTTATDYANAYFNFDPKETVQANCSGSEFRASAPASAIGSEIGAALAPASYVPKVNVGGGYLPASAMQTESWVLSL